MKDIPTLEQLVQSDKVCYAEYLLLREANHCNVFHRPEVCEQIRPMHRSDFYKISLIQGKGTLQIKGKVIHVNGNVLILYHPEIPYYWKPLSEEKTTYSCLFDSHFVSNFLSSKYFKTSPLFDTSLNPVFELNVEQATDLVFIFGRMYKEVNSDYHHKYDTLATYVQLLVQEAFKSANQSKRTSVNKSASTRITSAFLNLLERQFPIDSTGNTVLLKSPIDFSNRLSVHVNHLNHVIKETTGKSTTEIISSRFIDEAKALLQHSDASVSEIAYSLGFEHPSSFNSFFKKKTKQTPRQFR